MLADAGFGQVEQPKQVIVTEGREVGSRVSVLLCLEGAARLALLRLEWRDPFTDSAVGVLVEYGAGKWLDADALAGEPRPLGVVAGRDDIKTRTARRELRFGHEVLSLVEAEPCLGGLTFGGGDIDTDQPDGDAGVVELKRLELLLGGELGSQ